MANAIERYSGDRYPGWAIGELFSDFPWREAHEFWCGKRCTHILILDAYARLTIADLPPFIQRRMVA